MSVQASRLAGVLRRRGAHRLAGNAALGSFTAFLAVILSIRIGTNLFWAIDLTTRHPYVRLAQIASAHFLLISAYLIWIGSLSSFRLGASLPSPSFIDTLPGGKAFLAAFKTRTAFLRPLHLALALIIAGIAAAFLPVGREDLPLIAPRAVLALLVSFAGLGLLRAVMEWIPPERSEAQLLELLASMFLVYINVDLNFVQGGTVALIALKYYAFRSTWGYGAALCAIILIEAAVLLALKLLSLLRRASRRRGALGPLEHWYFRLFKLRIWLLLYAMIMPVWLSSMIPPRTKLWALLLFAGASVAAFLSVITQWENTLQGQWRRSLLDRRNRRLLVRPLLIHLLFTAIPVLGYLALK